jgi:hypothetical protein
MREKDLWSMVHGAWPHVHATRIENTATFGVPDVNCCYQGVEFWLELKVAAGDFVVVRPTQLAWIIKHLKVNGKVFILVAIPNHNQIALYNAIDLFQEGALLKANSQIKFNIRLNKPAYQVEMNRASLIYLLDKIVVYNE